MTVRRKGKSNPSNTIPREQVAVNLAASWGVGLRAFWRQAIPGRPGKRGESGERTRPRDVDSSWIALRRSPVRARLAPFADRNPACCAGHDDFDRPHVSIRAAAADAGGAGLDGDRPA